MMVRKTFHNGERWFAILDIVEALTNSTNPTQYIKDMKRRDKELLKGWGQIATPLYYTNGLMTSETKNCANTEGAFRIIQSIEKIISKENFLLKKENKRL